MVTQRSQSSERTTWLKRAGVLAVGFDSAVQAELPVKGTFDALINLAMPGATEAAREPETSRTRALATANACLRLIKGGRAGRLIQFSTFHVYGDVARARYCERDPAAPVHPYGRIHAECERLLLDETAGVPACVVRPANLVGRPAHGDLRDQAKLLFLDLCRQASTGALKLHNDGLSYRVFLPFADAIDAVRMLLHAPLEGERLFNLAAGEAQRLDEVARLVQTAATRVTGRAPALEFGAGRDSFRQAFAVDITRLQALGWQPHGSLAEEAEQVARFFLERA